MEMAIKILIWSNLILIALFFVIIFIRNIIWFLCDFDGFDDFIDGLFDDLDEFCSLDEDICLKKIMLWIYLPLSLVLVTLLTFQCSWWYAFLYFLVIFPQIVAIVVLFLNIVLAVCIFVVLWLIFGMPGYIWRGLRLVFSKKASSES